MGKQSDARRKAKLKERQRRVEAAAARSSGVNSNVAAFFKAYDSEPNVIAELLDESGGLSLTLREAQTARTGR